MDLIVVQQVARELNELLPGGFINKIHQPLPREIVLRIRLRGGGGTKLVLSADPQLGRIHLTDVKIPNPPTPPRLCAYLRAHFQGSRIVEVSAAADDRVVRMSTIRGPDSAKLERDLVLEILGRDSNIILVDRSSHRIMECLHRIPEKETGSRVVMPGLSYSPPPKSSSQVGPSLDSPVATQISPGIRIGPGKKRRLVLDAVAPDDRVFQTMNEAADAYFGSRLESALLAASRRDAVAPVKAKIRSLARRISKIQGDVDRLLRYEIRLHEGELLKANLRSAKKGMEELEVLDWMTESERVITLDPTLGPVANMQRIFSKAAKGKRGKTVAEQRLQETIDEKQALEDILFLAEKSNDVDELESLALWARSLRRKGTVSGKGKTGMASPQESQLYRELRTPSNRQVFVGRSGKGNDFLVRRKSRKGDMWFHVKGMPGAHVLLPERGKEPASVEEMEFAAALAVHFSKAQGGSKVEVMVADVADLRRPKHAHPGQVIVKSYMTMVSDGLTPKDIKSLSSF
jgi:predicted ribosome quality control (RQC) complex YloA/Tae2 family protein